MGGESFSDALFQVIEVNVLSVKSLDMILGIHEHLHCFDQIRASHHVDEIKTDKWNTEPELNRIQKFILCEESFLILRSFTVKDFIGLVDEIAEEGLFLVFACQVLSALGVHFSLALLN